MSWRVVARQILVGLPLSWRARALLVAADLFRSYQQIVVSWARAGGSHSAQARPHQPTVVFCRSVRVILEEGTEVALSLELGVVSVEMADQPFSNRVL